MRFSVFLSLMMAGTAMCSPMKQASSSAKSNPTSESFNGQDVSTEVLLDQLQKAVGNEAKFISIAQKLPVSELESQMYTVIVNNPRMFNRLLTARFNQPANDAHSENKILSKMFEYVVCTSYRYSSTIDVHSVALQLLPLEGISSQSLNNALKCVSRHPFNTDIELLVRIAQHIHDRPWLLDTDGFIKAIRTVPRHLRNAFAQGIGFQIASLDWFPTWTAVFKEDDRDKLRALLRDIKDYGIGFTDEQYIEIFAKMVTKYPIETIEEFGIFSSEDSTANVVYQWMLKGIVKAFRTSGIPDDKFSALIYHLAVKFEKSVDQVKVDMRKY